MVADAAAGCPQCGAKAPATRRKVQVILPEAQLQALAIVAEQVTADPDHQDGMGLSHQERLDARRASEKLWAALRASRQGKGTLL